MKQSLFIFLAGCLICACSASALAANRLVKRGGPLKHLPYPLYAQQEILIKFRTNFTKTDSQNLQNQIHVQAVTRSQAIAAFHAHYGTQQIGRDILGWQRVKLPAGKTVEQALAEFPGSPIVEKAEPNYIRHAIALSNTYTAFAQPNDPAYQNGSTWWFSRNHSDEAFNQPYYFTGSTVIVAVVDTGIDLSHPDLSSRLVSGYSEVNYTTSPQDDEGHGTHVAGLIAATTNNSTGIPGTAYMPGVKLMPVKVLDNTGSGYSTDIANGTEWAIQNGARVINMSFGGYGSSPSSVEAQSYNEALTAGCVLVAAAGNDGVNMDCPFDSVLYDNGNGTPNGPFWPACYPGIIAVAATDSEDYSTGYSNSGSAVALSAPGGGSTTAGDAEYDGGIYSTYLPETYAALCGTSMAAPQVSGAAAMLLLQQPGLTVAQVRTLLTTSCDQLYNGQEPLWVGAGKLNAKQAYGAYKGTPTITPTPTISPTATITPTASPSPTLTATVTPWTVPLDQVLVYPNPATGNTVNFTYSLTAPGSLSFDVFNIAGLRVAHMEEHNRPAGYNQISVWDIHNIAPGVYLYKVTITATSGQQTTTAFKRIVVAR